ncbi:MAG: hypothetical protein KF764_06740 [Labilithrix sp.]|nr:hypothetical protein [Labilithrix sp.]MBX3219409.1 hypothetical protein [Labilithrix sp.]
MLQTDARSDLVRTAETYEAPPPRDRLPTLPMDLSEFAWIHTGPPSWSDGAGDETAACPSELDSPGVGLASSSAHDVVATEPHDGVDVEALVDLWHSDVPSVVADAESVFDPSEARILELVDGRASVGTLLETSGLLLPDLLGSLGELCARGVLALDRSRRPAR